MEATKSSRESESILSDRQIEYFLLLTGLSKKLGDEHSKRFVAFARKFGLNPFKRELNCFIDGSGEKRTVHILVGYEVYIKRAERSGLLDGWDVRIEGSGNEMRAIIEIHRKDWTNAFLHEVYWTEAAQKTADGTLTPFWQRMPRFQLKKVAISQGFRLCFSDLLGGMPYEAAELSIESSEIPASVNADQDLALLADRPQTTEIPRTQSFDPKTFHSPFIDLDHFLKQNSDYFTATHIEWIKAKIQETRTEEKARAMLAYARKFVRNKQSGAPEKFNNRYSTKATQRVPATAF